MFNYWMAVRREQQCTRTSYAMQFALGSNFNRSMTVKDLCVFYGFWSETVAVIGSEVANMGEPWGEHWVDGKHEDDGVSLPLHQHEKRDAREDMGAFKKTRRLRKVKPMMMYPRRSWT